MKPFKTAFPRLFSLLLSLLLTAALAPAALAAPVNTLTITSQAEWDALFDANGQTVSCDQVEIAGVDIVNSKPFTCNKLIINGGGKLTSSADITAPTTEVIKGTLTMNDGTNFDGNITCETAGRLDAPSIYGDVTVKDFAMLLDIARFHIHNGTFTNNSLTALYGFDDLSANLEMGKWAKFTDCKPPALTLPAPASNGDGRLSWPAVPGAAEYTVNLYKDSVQNAPIATITTANLSYDFSDAIKAAGSGDYYLGAQTIAKAAENDGSDNWYVYYSSPLSFNYSALQYTAPANKHTITSQAEWDALFDANGQTVSCEEVEITAGDIVNSKPFTCTKLIINGGNFTSSADINATAVVSTGTLTMQNGADFYGNITVSGGELNTSSGVYGDVFYKDGRLIDGPVLHNGMFFNQKTSNPYISVSLPGMPTSLQWGKWAKFTDCKPPALTQPAPAQNGDGRLSWPAVPGAAEYTVNLYKDSPQNAPIATVTTASLSCDFSDAIKAAGSGDYYLGAQTIAKAAENDGSDNWYVYYSSPLSFNYSALQYTAPANKHTITSQAEWDALFDANGQTVSCDQVEIAGVDIVNSKPFTCNKLIISGDGKLTSSADITATAVVSSGTLTMQNGADFYGNITVSGGKLDTSSGVYGDVFYKDGRILNAPVLHNGTLFNQTQLPGILVNGLPGMPAPLYWTQWAKFTDCKPPALTQPAPAQNGDGRLSWPAVPGAAEYTVNLYKDSPQNAPIATVTTASLSCDFSDAIKAAGSGDYYLSAKALAKAAENDGSDNWYVYFDSPLFFDYASLHYTAPAPTPTPTPQPQPTPTPPPAKENPDTGVRSPVSGSPVWYLLTVPAVLAAGLWAVCKKSASRKKQ